MINLTGVSVQQSTGRFQKIDELKGCVLVIVNVASDCHYTEQYHALRQLDLLYSARGLRILAFPCNDFGGQEPLDIKEIQRYVEQSFRLPFKLYAKVNIVANKSAPYDILTAPPARQVQWNFEKYLVDKDSNVVAHFDTSMVPQHPEFIAKIEELLN